MYIFSVTAKTRETIKGFAKDEEVPFIVYIDFKDLFGAEALCQLFLRKEGFYDVVVEKRKQIPDENRENKKLLDADKALRDAIETGYAIQMFDAH